MSELDDVVHDFLIESRENLDQLDRDFVGLEKDPGAAALLGSIFRTIHTIKGTSGFLAFGKLEALTHAGESLLSRMRDGKQALTAEITSALLAMVDQVRSILGNIEATGCEGEEEYSGLIARLTRLQEPAASEPDTSSATKVDAGRAQAASSVVSQGEECKPVGQMLIEHAGVDPSEVEKARQIQQQGDLRPLAEILVDRGAVAPAAARDVIEKQKDARAASLSESSIRVDVALLDKLMNLVGELVLARNQIVQFSNRWQDPAFLNASQRLNLITTELQGGAMKTRMQPIGNLWSRLPRIVRDLALAGGKQVRVETEGKATELDKTLIEAIKDPLTHIVRNSVDHGIETPEVRAASGKCPEGLLFLRAFHEGGQVNIEISDDGAGLDFHKIRAKAVQKGLVTTDQAARMSEREVANLIWSPGFSTADKVSNVSGRGVGMDVVKTNIEKIGGTVDVQSGAGQGCTVRMKIPLTLAIIPALIVSTAGDRYAIPQVSLLELVRLEGEQARKGIELVNGAPVHRLRGHLLPLVYLNRELHGDAQAPDAGLGGDGLDFAQARIKHEQWIGRLRQVLDGAITMTLEQAGSPTECALGKWLYASGLARHPNVEEMQELESAHRRLHELARRVVTHRLGGNRVEAVRELAAVEQLSATILGLLTLAERKVVEAHNANIVVLRADEQQFGLVVDEINDTEEIVVKPLSKQLKSINTYAGATIMGDGRVALILDVLGLAQRANVVSERRDRAVSDQEKRAQELAAGDTRNAVLLFQHGDAGRIAIDLSQVARLEEFPLEAIEVAGDQEVVQYRGRIMPLVRVSDVVANSRRKAADSAGGPLQVVVYADEGRSVGLVVDRILDIVEESFVVQPQTGRKGTLGSAVIQKRVTDILDVPGLITAAGVTA